MVHPPLKKMVGREDLNPAQLAKLLSDLQLLGFQFAAVDINESDMSV